MQGLVESVRSGGVNQPALVRPREDGGYEIIAGHRRQRASELAGFGNMPCIIRELTDDQAVLAMTDDNLRHREKLLPSEKAAALQQQYEAIKHQGARGDDDEAGYDKVLGASNLPMLRYEWVWYKSRCSGFLNARRAPLKKSENILVFYRKSPLYDPQFEQGEPYKKIHRKSGNSPNYGKFERTSGESDGRRFPGNVLAFPTVANAVHPTQKPVSLCEYFIRTYTRPGEVVADICAGSGTTAVAAVNTGRRYICFENAPAFYGPAAERVRRAEEAVAQGGKGL